MNYSSILTLSFSALLVLSNACAKELPDDILQSLHNARIGDLPDSIPDTSGIAPEATNVWAQIVWAPPTNGLHLGVLLIRSTANLLLRSDIYTNAPHWFAPPGFRRLEAELRDASGAPVALRAPGQFSTGTVYTNLSQIPKDKHHFSKGWLHPALEGAIGYTSLNLPATFRIQAAGDYTLRIKGRVMMLIPKSRGELTTIEFPWISLSVHVREEVLGHAASGK